MSAGPPFDDDDLDFPPYATGSEVLSHGRSPALGQNIARVWAGSWAGRHRFAVRRVLTMIVLVAGLVVVVIARRPAPLPPLSDALVTGISIDVRPSSLLDGTAGAIVATYQVANSPTGARFSVEGVTGPFVDTSTTRRTPAAGGVGELYTVIATPDCSNPESLDAGLSPYLISMTVADPDGRSSGGHLRLTGGLVDWDAAVRQDCWQRLMAGSLHIQGVRTELHKAARRVDLSVSLRNASPRDVRVGVIDIADVSTVEAADSGVLPAGTHATLRVRLQIRDCSSPVLPVSTFVTDAADGPAPGPALAWSVGPVDADPIALLQTVLGPRQLATVRASVQRLCEPPDTRITVTGSHVLPTNPVVVDRTGVSIGVHLALASAQPRLVVGDDQSGLTADARVPTTQAAVRLSDDRGTATIVWRARCSTADLSPPVLPVWFAVRSRPVGYAVSLRDASLAMTYARACGITDPSLLRSAGWDVRELEPRR